MTLNMSIDLRNSWKSKWTWIAICKVAAAILATGLGYRHRRTAFAAESLGSGAYCDNGIAAARSHAAAAPPAGTSAMSPSQTAWVPGVSDRKSAGPAPEGMIWIPGGRFWMGADDDHMQDTKPWHRVSVDAFWMDRTEVTNEQFALFAEARAT